MDLVVVVVAVVCDLWLFCEPNLQVGAILSR